MIDPLIPIQSAKHDRLTETVIVLTLVTALIGGAIILAALLRLAALISGAM